MKEWFTGLSGTDAARALTRRMQDKPIGKDQGRRIILIPGGDLNNSPGLHGETPLARGHVQLLCLMTEGENTTRPQAALVSRFCHAAPLTTPSAQVPSMVTVSPVHGDQ
jgi:hypothetical protein